MLSAEFVARLRAAPVPAYKLAKRAGVTPYWLSRLLSYADAVRARDARIIRLGRLVGLEPEQVFLDSSGRG